MMSCTATLQAPAAARRATTCQAVQPKPVALVRRAAAALGAAVVLGASGLPAHADLTLGREVFDNNCAACHTGGRNVVQVEKTLEKAALEQYLDGGFSEASIVKQVENGKNAMPAWAGRLSDDEIQSVAAYVYNQAANNLW